MRTSARDSAGGLAIERALSAAGATFHPLLASFTRAGELRGHHRVMFVSPRHEDGTTTIAVCSALMLVRLFRCSVALVEANIYTPAMADYLEIPSEPGLLDQLDGRCDADAVVRVVEGMHVLTAGGARNPREGALASEEIRSQIRAVAERQEHLILDAPPLLEHPEACLLLEHVDEVILVVRAGSTRDEEAKAVQRIVENGGAEVSGLLLNRFEPDLPFGRRSITPV